MINSHVLDGCRPTLMSSYLKALGILRIVARKDSHVTACWKNSRFVLKTYLSRKSLVDFIADDYVPTPVIAPWSYNKYKKTIESLTDLLKGKRFIHYKNVIDKIDAAEKDFCTILIKRDEHDNNNIEYKKGDKKKLLESLLGKGLREPVLSRMSPDEQAKLDLFLKPDPKKTKNPNDPGSLKNLYADKIKKEKALFLRLCRNNFPDEAIAYLDAVFALKDKVEFAPLAGSGMNDGNYDMAENFVKYLKKLLDGKSKRGPSSEARLRSALFVEEDVKLDETPMPNAETMPSRIFLVEEDVKLDETPMVGHNPDAAGGPNSGEGFKGKSLSNPWEYVLMVEGMMLFAGNMARRQSTSRGRAAFPFTTNASNIGYATASRHEDNMGEIWLPIWDNPATYREVAHMFSEGRAQLGGRQAETGTEFARSMISMGTERGITAFQRFCVMKRKGKAHLYINTGKIRTRNKPSAVLLNDLDGWSGHILKQSSANDAPATLRRLARAFDSSLMKFCKHPKPEHLLDLLIAIGKIERYISGQGDFSPLQRLSSDWLDKCYDGSAEYRLAASIASIQPRENVGSIRENLENIQKEKDSWKHDRNSKHFVWKEDLGLLKNMADTLQRRAMDGKINSLDHVPIDGAIHARLWDVVKFLNGDVDMKKINDLVLPLSIISPNHQTGYPWSNMREKRDPPALPEHYIITKLVYFPNICGKIQSATSTTTIPYDMSVLTLLNAKRIDDGCAKASHILHAHGLSPWTHVNTKAYSRVSLPESLQERITAALLFPISPLDGLEMMRVAIKLNDEDT